MHTVIMQGLDGAQLQAILACARAAGVARVAFPAREYGSKSGNDKALRYPKALYETARLLPRGDDEGFAERFLRGRDT